MINTRSRRSSVSSPSQKQHEASANRPMSMAREAEMIRSTVSGWKSALVSARTRWGIADIVFALMLDFDALAPSLVGVVLCDRLIQSSIGVGGMLHVPPA